MVVVDSSVMIPLLRVGKLNLLKDFFGKINITKDIRQEINEGKLGASEFEEAVNNWILVSNLKEGNIEKTAEQEGIENADVSVLFLAREKDNILLSNDYCLNMVAKAKGVKTWWLTTFIFECIRKDILEKDEAKEILNDLIDKGMNPNKKVYSAVLRKIDGL